MDISHEQPQEVEDFWSSRIGKAYRQMIQPTNRFIEITKDRPFPPDYLDILQSTPRDHKLYAGIFHSGSSMWDEHTITQLDVFTRAVGRVTDADWTNILKLHLTQHYLSHEIEAVPRQRDKDVHSYFRNPNYQEIKRHFKTMTANTTTSDAKYWKHLVKTPDVVIYTYIAQELVLEDPDRERFSTLADLETFASRQGLHLYWREIMEGFENIFSKEYVHRLLESGVLKREVLPLYFANAASWVLGAALKWQQTLTDQELAVPFRRRHNPLLDPPLEALPVMMEATRKFYENLPLAVSESSAVAPQDLIHNGIDLIRYFEKIVQENRRTPKPLLSSDLPLSTIEKAVWDELETEAEKLKKVVVELGNNPGLLARRAVDSTVPGTALGQIADLQQTVRDAGGNTLYWGAAHFPFADRSGILW